MSGFTRSEALAFIEALRLDLGGKVGFRWFVDRLAGLSEYIESTGAENDHLNAYIDRAGVRSEYESWLRDQGTSESGHPAQQAHPADAD